MGVGKGVEEVAEGGCGTAGERQVDGARAGPGGVQGGDGADEVAGALVVVESA